MHKGGGDDDYDNNNNNNRELVPITDQHEKRSHHIDHPSQPTFLPAGCTGLSPNPTTSYRKQRSRAMIYRCGRCAKHFGFLFRDSDTTGRPVKPVIRITVNWGCRYSPALHSQPDYRFTLTLWLLLSGQKE
jgi:hypothetical protein